MVQDGGMRVLDRGSFFLKRGIVDVSSVNVEIAKRSLECILKNVRNWYCKFTYLFFLIFKKKLTMWKGVVLCNLPITSLVDLVGEYVLICQTCENPMTKSFNCPCPSGCWLPFCSKECVEKHQQDPTHQRTCTTCGNSSCHRTRCTFCKQILCGKCVEICENCDHPYHNSCATESWICQIRGCWNCGNGAFCKIPSCIQCKQQLLICGECCPNYACSYCLESPMHEGLGQKAHYQEKSCPNGWVGWKGLTAFVQSQNETRNSISEY